MKNLICSFLLLTTCGILQAQSVDSVQSNADTTRFDPSKTLIKWHFMGFLEPDPIVQFGVEHKFNHWFSAQLSAGYILNADIWKGSFGDYYNLRGYRARGELRAYMPGCDCYVAGDMMYKQIWFSQTDEIGFNCVDGICDYQMTGEYDVNKRIFAYHLKYGSEGLLSSRLNLYYDFYLGVGIRHIWSDVYDLPEGAELWWSRRGLFNWTDDTDRVLPSATMAFQLAYRLR